MTIMIIGSSFTWIFTMDALQGYHHHLTLLFTQLTERVNPKVVRIVMILVLDITIAKTLATQLSCTIGMAITMDVECSSPFREG
jgi:hypothetical protein